MNKSLKGVKKRTLTLFISVKGVPSGLLVCMTNVPAATVQELKKAGILVFITYRASALNVHPLTNHTMLKTTEEFVEYAWEKWPNPKDHDRRIEMAETYRFFLGEEDPLTEDDALYKKVYTKNNPKLYTISITIEVETAVEGAFEKIKVALPRALRIGFDNPAHRIALPGHVNVVSMLNLEVKEL